MFEKMKPVIRVFFYYKVTEALNIIAIFSSVLGKFYQNFPYVYNPLINKFSTYTIKNS